MSYFQRMYEAALADNDVELKALLAAGACIDEREQNEDFMTVAGKLAYQGHVKKALKLVNRFGASPEFVVHGLMEAGYLEDANALVEEYAIDIAEEHFQLINDGKSLYHNLISSHGTNRLKRLAHVGDMDSIDLTIPGNKHIAFSLATYAGHIGFVERHYTSENLPPNLTGLIMDVALDLKTMRFNTPQLALHTLSFVTDDDFRDYLYNELRQVSIFVYDVKEIVKKAKKIRIIMDDFDMDYAAAWKCVHSENLAEAIKTWQLMCAMNLQEPEAKAILKSPGFRYWLRRMPNRLGNVSEVLPLEIQKFINEFVIGRETKKPCYDLDSIIKLKPLNHSSGLFQKTTKTIDEGIDSVRGLKRKRM